MNRIFLFGLMFLLVLSIPAFADNILNTTNMGSTSSDTRKFGINVTANNSAYISSVGLNKSAGATTVYIYNSAGSQLGSASVVGYVATFSPTVAITAGSRYYIVADSAGSSYTLVRNDGPSWPYVGYDMNATKGIYNNSGVWTDINAIYNVRNVTTQISEETMTISLNSPVNGNTTTNTFNVSFNFTPIWTADDLYNCSLWLNSTGSWVLNLTNTSEITNNTEYIINQNLTNSSYIWNVGCYNSTDQVFAPSNFTLTLNSPHITFTSLSSNETSGGNPINFSVVIDSTTPYIVSGWIFETNNTGTLVNTTWASSGATSLTATNITTLNSTNGVAVLYKFYANDSMGIWSSVNSTVTTLGSQWMCPSQDLYCKNLLINNSQNAMNGKNYTLEVYLTNVSGMDASRYDLRFFNAPCNTTGTQLGMYVWNSTHVSIFINDTTGIPSSGSRNISYCYSNTTAISSVSNIKDAYIMADDFETYSTGNAFSGANPMLNDSDGSKYWYQARCNTTYWGCNINDTAHGSSCNYILNSTSGNIVFQWNNTAGGSTNVCGIQSTNELIWINLTAHVDLRVLTSTPKGYAPFNPLVSNDSQGNLSSENYYNQGGWKCGVWMYSYWQPVSGSPYGSWNSTMNSWYPAQNLWANWTFLINNSGYYTYLNGTLMDFTTANSPVAYYNGTADYPTVTNAPMMNYPMHEQLVDYITTGGGVVEQYDNFTIKRYMNPEPTATIMEEEYASNLTTSVYLWLNGTQNNKTYTQNSIANLTAQTNIEGLTVNISTNITGWEEPTDTTTVYNETNLSDIGVFNITAYTLGNGTYGSASVTYFATVTSGDNAPAYSGISTNYPSSYSTTQNTWMNLTWTDDNEVSIAFIESNFSGTPTNYTASNESSTYYLNRTLPAGTFYWKSYANDTADQWNISTTQTFTINKLSPSLTLMANTSWTVYYPTATNVSGGGCPSQVACTLYRNNIPIATPDDNQLLSVGSYSYVWNTSGGQNYTSKSTSNSLVVLSSGTPPVGLTLRYNKTTNTLGNSIWNETWTSGGNKTFYVNLPKNATVIDAKLNLSGYQLETEIEDTYIENKTADERTGGSTFDGTYLWWQGDYHGRLNKILPNGSSSVYWTGFSNFMSIAYLNPDLWLSFFNTGNITKRNYSNPTQILNYFQLRDNSAVRLLSSNGTFLIASQGTTIYWINQTKGIEDGYCNTTNNCLLDNCTIIESGFSGLYDGEYYLDKFYLGYQNGTTYKFARLNKTCGLEKIYNNVETNGWGGSFSSISIDTNNPQYMYVGSGSRVNTNAYFKKFAKYVAINISSTNPYLDVSGNGDTEWSFSGEFNQTNNQTSNFSTEIQSYLDSCVPYADGTCDVPFVLHSDSAGIIRINLNATVTYDTETYDETVTEGVNATFWIQVNSTSDITDVNATLNWNGTNYNHSTKNHTSTYWTFTRVLTVPSITSEENVSFYWNFSYSNSSGIYIQNFSTKNQTITVMNLVNCTVGTTNRTLNFTGYDEETNALMNFSMDINIDYKTSLSSTYSKNLSLSLSGNNTYYICLSPETSTFYANATIKYWNTSYSTRYYYLVNTSLSNNSQEIYLYLLGDAYASWIQYYLKKEGDLPYSNVIIKAQRYFEGSNTYLTVAHMKTDYKGFDGTYLRMNQWYKYIIEKDGTVLKNYDPVFLNQTTETLRVSTVDTPSYYKYWNSLAYSCAFNASGTNVLSCSVTDTSGKMTHSILTVTRHGSLADVEQCNTSSTSSSSTLVCDLSSPAGNYTYSYKLIGRFVASDPTWYLLQTGSVIVGVLENLFGTTGVFVMSLIVMIFAIGGIWNPAVSLTLTGASIALGWYWGIFSLGSAGYTILIALLSVIALAIWKVRT